MTEEREAEEKDLTIILSSTDGRKNIYRSTLQMLTLESSDSIVLAELSACVCNQEKGRQFLYD